MLNFDGDADHADEVHRVAQFLLPRYLCRFGVRNRDGVAVVVIFSTVLHRAFQTAR